MRLLIIFVIVFSCINLTLTALFDNVCASKTKLKKLKKIGGVGSISSISSANTISTVPVSDLIQSHGYPVEKHTVKTSDGYTLLVHRISHGATYNNSTVRRQPVLLTHGLFANSAIWVVNGPGKGLAYILADAGYDVWLLSFRGTTENKPSSDSKFWNFSFQEIGEHDIPATIDHIYSTKARESPSYANVADLLYVGHSMGTTTLFVTLSSKVEYNKKIKAAFALAPFVFTDGLQFPFDTVLSLGKPIQGILKISGNYQYSPLKTINELMNRCTLASPRRFCENVVLTMSGYDREHYEKTIYTDLCNSIAPISVKTLVHFSQLVKANNKFQKFDYGPVKNIFKYGQSSTPQFDLSAITTPIALFYGQLDDLATPRDAEKLYATIQNTAIGLYKVDTFTHNQFAMGTRAPDLVFNRILRLMNNYR